MQDRSQKRSTIGIVAVALLTLLILIGILFMPGNDDRWDAMRSRVAKLTDEARSRNVSRPVLRGEPRPGNAWMSTTSPLTRHSTLKKKETAPSSRSSTIATRARTGPRRYDSSRHTQASSITFASEPSSPMANTLTSGAGPRSAYFPACWPPGERLNWR